MNPLAVLGFIKDHWRGCAAAAALAAAFFGGYRTHARLNPPVVCAPAVTKIEDDHKASSSNSVQDTTTETGAKRKITLNFDPSPGANARLANAHDITPKDLCRPVVVPGLADPVDVPAGERLESVTIEDEGGSTTETKAATQAQAAQDSHLDLTVKPAAAAPLPTRALQLGLEDVLHRKLNEVRLAGRVRLFNSPCWGELSTKPLHRCDDGRWCPQLGLAAAWEF